MVARLLRRARKTGRAWVIVLVNTVDALAWIRGSANRLYSGDSQPDVVDATRPAIAHAEVSPPRCRHPSFPGTLRIRRYLASNHGAFRGQSNLFLATWNKTVQGLDIMIEIKPNILSDLIFVSIFSKFQVREAALWTW